MENKHILSYDCVVMDDGQLRDVIMLLLNDAQIKDITTDK